MGYIENGLVRFYVAHESGKEKTIHFTGPGACCVLYSPPRKFKMEYDANRFQALTDVDIIAVPQKDVQGMFKENPDFHLRMTDVYVKFVNLLLFASMGLAFNEITTRVCNFLYILYLVKKESSFSLSQEAIASSVGASRVNVSKALGKLKEKGIIQTGRNNVEILNLEGLMDYCTWDVLG